MKVSDIFLTEAASTIEKALIMSKQGDLFKSSNFIDLYWSWIKGSDNEKYDILVKDLRSFKSGKSKRIKKLKFVGNKKELAIKSLEDKKKELEKKLKINPKVKDWRRYEKIRKKVQTGMKETKGEVSFSSDRTAAIADMVIKNNFNWNFFTSSFFGKEDIQRLKSSIRIPSGVMSDQDKVEVKLMRNPRVGQKHRFADMIDLRNRSAWNKFKKILEKDAGRNLKDTEVTQKYQNWLNTTATKALSNDNKKAQALIRKAISDNKEFKTNLGDFNKTFEANDYKFSFKKIPPRAPSTGLPAVGRIELQIEIPKSAKIIEDEFLDFTKELLSG
ncbi:MAG: hypothetical protein DRJ01_11655 [Bacteroidetes bacterium]|nr:MAG: hypothetical protein DRJ01_11655 [Bacteroidota bacterium]